MKTFTIFIIISITVFQLGFNMIGFIIGYASLFALASELLTSFKITKK